jgi:hypothetical protein
MCEMRLLTSREIGRGLAHMAQEIAERNKVGKISFQR